MIKRPLMILFDENPGVAGLAGMVAWGGKRMTLNELRKDDLASRLGARGIWLDSLLEKITDLDPGALILMNPDMSAFLGDQADNWKRLRTWLDEKGIGLRVLRTNRRQAA